MRLRIRDDRGKGIHFESLAFKNDKETQYRDTILHPHGNFMY